MLPKDLAGNAHMGDVLYTESRNTLVHAISRLVSVAGVDDLIVIETPDAVLAANSTSSQNVMHIVKALSKQGSDDPNLHRKVYCPWGWHDSVDASGRLKVKRIRVKQVPRSAYKSITTAPSIGWWWRARRKLPTATRSCC